MAKFRPPQASAKPKDLRDRSPKPRVQNSNSRQSLPEGIFIVEGAAAIREYLRFKPQTVKKIFAKERQLAAVRKEFAGFEVKLESVAESTVTDERVLPATPVWAHVHHELTDWLSFESYLTKTKSKNELVLALDHISDPRNLGAIVRSAAFFGVKKIIVPERRQVLLTQSGVGTAQGGFALCDLVIVVNLARALEDLKSKDFWILGAAMNGEAIDAVRGRYERQILVLGSEDKGIGPNVADKCDVLVSIPGAAKALDSLNVSVAAGILLQRLIVLP